MFTRFISLLVLVAPLASALTLSTPPDVNVGGTINITWTSSQGDPSTWSFELVNPGVITSFAIANNVDPSTGSLNPLCPTVPPSSGYTVEAVNISNINQVIAVTGSFSIAAAISSSVSGSTTVSATGSSTNTLPSTANSLPVTSSITSGVTTSSTGTGTGTGTGTTGSTGTGAGTGTAASTTPTSAAVSTRLALSNACGYAVLLLSAVAGAAAVAL